MYELPVDLDRDVTEVPPTGQYRVYDRRTWDGPMVNLVGDFPSFTMAMDFLRLARHPFTRVVVNDMGVVIGSFTPSSAGLPDAGSES